MTDKLGIILALILAAWSAAPVGATFSDSLGRQVSLQAQPRRIVSLAPSLTEIVFYLGLEDRLVGVTKYSTYPPAATLLPRVGSYVDINVERIISLRPDLIIATADGNQPEKVALLERAGLPVFIVNPRNIRQVVDTVASLGHLLGSGSQATRQAQQLSSQIDNIVAKTAGRPRPLVFLQINTKPIMTVNRNSFLHDLIHLAGGRNMAADEPATYPRISIEQVIRHKPEVIIISSMQRDGGFASAQKQWLRWPMIPAVRNQRVHLVDSDLTDRPSPRVIEGLEAIARLLHPQAAWDD